MHWVERGPEPEGLEPIRSRYTTRWVDHYRNGVGIKPRDSRWLEFHRALLDVFSGRCAYCEEYVRGEIDHFRPKSRFPELTYEWSNWVFACHDCNQTKGEKWPSDGYVDPCAKYRPDQPENIFDFDSLTGEILPKVGLSLTYSDKAQRMIVDLGLNDNHHLRKRLGWLRMVSGAISDSPDTQTPSERDIRAHLSARSTQWSSITRTWLSERGYSLDT